MVLPCEVLVLTVSCKSCAAVVYGSSRATTWQSESQRYIHTEDMFHVASTGFSFAGDDVSAYPLIDSYSMFCPARQELAG